MSKIQSEIIKLSGTKLPRGNDRQVIIEALIAAVTGLSDEQWEELSGPAQDWFNEAVDAKNAKKKSLPDVPDFEEAEEEKEEPAKSTRRASKQEEPQDEPAGKSPAKSTAKPKVGSTVRIITKRGKDLTGVIVELDDDTVVIKHGNGEEVELARDRIETMTVAGGEAEEEGKDPIRIGAVVSVTTKRGKDLTGVIVELDDEVIVLDVEGEEVEFQRARVETIKAVDGKKSAKPTAGDEEEEAPAKASRKAAKEEEAPAKATRVSNKEGVSIGTRIKELIADDMEASLADIGKALKKEGIEFKENTLALNYADAHKFVTILKAKKLLK